MSLAQIIEQMPKVELHVHLEGAIRPETLLKLARRNDMPLPADTVEGLRDWYTFRDFNHFVEIYIAASKCIKTPDDVEMIAREFADGQKAQNIVYTEAHYTAETIQRYCGIPWADQLAALKRARAYAKEIGIQLDFILDVVREVPVETGEQIVDWVIGAYGEGICGLGMSGREFEIPSTKHRAAFQRAKREGIKISTHAGETSGPQTIWDCLVELGADRIGHGVRCLEDDALVDELKSRQTPIEVCPSSNVCLCVARSISDHPIQAMLTRGLNVSVNSDDPPMFNTTLTEELQKCAEAFAWSEAQVVELQLRALDAAFCGEERKAELRETISGKVRAQHV